jgi:ribosome-associated protein
MIPRAADAVAGRPARGTMIRIHANLEIPETEVSFATSRSSGPGGQNVNKVESRVTLLFDLAASPSLTDEQRRRIASRLATRVNKAGVMRVVAQQHRTQAANREAALARFADLLAGALRRAPRRRPTRPPVAAARRRVADKRRKSRLKELRKGAGDES